MEPSKNPGENNLNIKIMEPLKNPYEDDDTSYIGENQAHVTFFDNVIAVGLGPWVKHIHILHPISHLSMGRIANELIEAGAQHKYMGEYLHDVYAILNKYNVQLYYRK